MNKKKMLWSSEWIKNKKDEKTVGRELSEVMLKNETKKNAMNLIV